MRRTVLTALALALPALALAPSTLRAADLRPEVSEAVRHDVSPSFRQLQLLKVAAPRPDREIVNRETTMDAKAKRGFRISGKERTAAAAVSQREHELNSGYAELAYAGLVTISSTASRDDLDRNAAAVENVAAESGVELQPLFGRQAEGWVSSLPLGRTITTRASL